MASDRRADPGGVGTPSRNTSWITLAGGLLITAFGVGYIGLSPHHTQHLRAANKRLDVQNGRFDAALSNMFQALLMFNSSERLVIANRRYYEMYKLSPDAVKPGCSLREMLDHQLKAGTFSGDANSHFSSRRNDRDEGINSQRIVELPDGRTIARVDHSMTGGGWVATHEDITERRIAEAKIAHMALHDALTNLPNRLFFREQMDNHLTHLRQVIRSRCFVLTSTDSRQ